MDMNSEFTFWLSLHVRKEPLSANCMETEWKPQTSGSVEAKNSK